MNGGQEGATDILVDGVSISLVSPNTQWNKGVSSDGVDEFKVLQSNFSPEYGESGDGIISLTMKSGTNQFHGSGYDYLRNNALEANSWINNLEGQKRSVDTQNDFGGTFGGPVFVPKLEPEARRYKVSPTQITAAVISQHYWLKRTPFNFMIPPPTRRSQGTSSPTIPITRRVR